MPMLTMSVNVLPVCAVNAAAVHAFDEVAHLLEARAHLRHHVLAVDEDRAVRAIAQGDVQDGAILGGVDLLAGEHRVDALVEAARVGELDQQSQRLCVDALAGEIEQQVQLGVREKLRGTLRVGGEQIAQMPLPHAVAACACRAPAIAASVATRLSSGVTSVVVEVPVDEALARRLSTGVAGR